MQRLRADLAQPDVPTGRDERTFALVAAIAQISRVTGARAVATGQGLMPPLEGAARERLLGRYLEVSPTIVRVVDAPRERRAAFTGTDEQYRDAVADWHRARVAKYVDALTSRAGDVGFLVWGDPAFYDSTIRIVDQIAELLPVEVDVIPGISSLQVLAARHRLVLHEVGRPLHVTTGRALGEAVAVGHDNLVVMLNRDVAPPELDDWQIWWGGNLGTANERLGAGRVGEVRTEIDAARTRLRETAGWMMDVYLLRRERPGRGA